MFFIFIVKNYLLFSYSQQELDFCSVILLNLVLFFFILMFKSWFDEDKSLVLVLAAFSVYLVPFTQRDSFTTRRTSLTQMIKK